MRKLALLALLVPGLAFSQISASAGIRIDLPVVLPQLVVVTPGVRVVPEVDHEVFLVNGFYWTREDGRWYRSRSHRGGWVVAPLRIVPASIVKIPPGHYKRWHKGKGHWKADKKGHEHHDREHHRREHKGRGDDGRGEREKHGHKKQGKQLNERGWKDRS